MQLECDENNFFIDLNSYKLDEYENICSNNSSWFSLKNEKKNKNKNLNSFKINEGDVIKIGKIIIRIRKIKLDSEKQNHKKINNIDINVDNNSDNKLSNSLTTERISDLKEIGENKISNNNESKNIEIKNENNIIKIQNKEEENNNEKDNEILSIHKNSINTTNKKLNPKLSEYKTFSEKNRTPFSDINQKCCRICYLAMLRFFKIYPFRMSKTMDRNQELDKS